LTVFTAFVPAGHLVVLARFEVVAGGVVAGVGFFVLLAVLLVVLLRGLLLLLRLPAYYRLGTRALLLLALLAGFSVALSTATTGVVPLASALAFTVF